MLAFGAAGPDRAMSPSGPTRNEIDNKAMKATLAGRRNLTSIAYSPSKDIDTGVD
jgi:hypothetical protein